MPYLQTENQQLIWHWGAQASLSYTDGGCQICCLWEPSSDRAFAYCVISLEGSFLGWFSLRRGEERMSICDQCQGDVFLAATPIYKSLNKRECVQCSYDLLISLSVDHTPGLFWQRCPGLKWPRPTVHCQTSIPIGGSPAVLLVVWWWIRHLSLTGYSTDDHLYLYAYDVEIFLL